MTQPTIIQITTTVHPTTGAIIIFGLATDQRVYSWHGQAWFLVRDPNNIDV